MKNQALFSSKDKSKKLKCPLLQFLFGTLRVRVSMIGHSHFQFLPAFSKWGQLFMQRIFSSSNKFFSLTLLHSERPKLYTILAFLSAIGLRVDFCLK